jgi:flagellar biosynthetic protein FliR
MNSLYMMSEVKMLVFCLVLIRMLAFIIASPIFGAAQISAPTKVLLCIVLATCLFPSIQIDLKVYDGLANDLISLAAREALVGLCLGFVSRMFFYTISMAGEIVSNSIGLNAGQMFNPLMGSPGNIVEQFYSILGMLFFFMVNGHHMLIAGLSQSFDFIRVGQLTFNAAPLGEMALFGQTILTITIKMCAPVMVAILLSQIAMGLLGRAIPQVNVLVTSFPVTIMLGMSVMIICIPLYLNGLNNLIEVVAVKMLQLMKALNG